MSHSSEDMVAREWNFFATHACASHSEACGAGRTCPTVESNGRSGGPARLPDAVRRGGESDHDEQIPRSFHFAALPENELDFSIRAEGRILRQRRISLRLRTDHRSSCRGRELNPHGPCGPQDFKS